MTTQYQELHSAVEGFMNANYPCSCPPDDPECSKNFYEADHIIQLAVEKISGFVEKLEFNAPGSDIAEMIRGEFEGESSE